MQFKATLYYRLKPSIEIIPVILILLIDFHVSKCHRIIRSDSEDLRIFDTTTISHLNDINYYQDYALLPKGSKYCAFMNVSDNSSYTLLDREDESEGLAKIHNSSDVFEKFYSVEIQEGCEVTICELQLLNAKGRVRKCFSSGTELWTDLQLQSNQRHNTTKKKSKPKAPDPMTSQYFVSTGCSCKEPTLNCSATMCKDVTLRDHDCGRMYKEPNCSECRYEARALNESESFSPSNTFWCQSFVFRKGCRLRVANLNPESQNYKYYSNSADYVEMDYVRYPYPTELTCICDGRDIEMNTTIEKGGTISTTNWLLPIAVLVGASVLALGIGVGLYKYGVPLQIGNWKSQPKIQDVISKFQFGFTNEEAQTFEQDMNKYVSFGFFTAVQQPYQNKWEIPRDKIKIDMKLKPLGMGQFGVVCLGTLNKDSAEMAETQVAVKMAKVSSNMTHFSSILDEIKILAFIGIHPNICCLIGACTQNIEMREALIILELCSQGNLKKYLMTNQKSFLESPTFDLKNAPLSPGNYTPISSLSISTKDENLRIKPQKLETLMSWCAQIACGMGFLGEKQVIHIDLAARNVLLTENLECKIGDFGLSRKIHEVVSYVRIGEEYPLPFQWMALESLTDLKFTTQSDVWSYGVVVYEILSLGQGPFPDISGVSALIETLSQGIRLRKPTHCSNEIYQMMMQCWEAEPESRPTFTNLQSFFEALL